MVISVEYSQFIQKDKRRIENNSTKERNKRREMRIGEERGKKENIYNKSNNSLRKSGVFGRAENFAEGKKLLH